MYFGQSEIRRFDRLLRQPFISLENDRRNPVISQSLVRIKNTAAAHFVRKHKISTAAGTRTAFYKAVVILIHL